MQFLQDTGSTNDFEFVYKIEDAAKVIGVQPSTISKYLTELDKQGYQFKRKPDGTRKITEQEIGIFRKIGELKSSKVTVEKAIETIVLAWKKQYSIESIERPATVTTEQVFDLLTKMMSKIEQIDSRTSMLEHQLGEQYLIESQETKKEIQEFKGYIDSIQGTLERQNALIHMNKELMEKSHNDVESVKKLVSDDLEQRKKVEENSRKFYEEFRNQTSQMINHELPSRVKTAMQEAELEKTKKRKGWFSFFKN